LKPRDIINAIVRDRECPERMGLFEHLWDDTQPEWEKQGLPPGVDIIDYFNYDIRPLTRLFNQTQAIIDQREVLEETDKTIVICNGWGAVCRYWKHKSGTPEHIDFELVNDDIWREKYRPHLLEVDLRRFGDLDDVRARFAEYKAGDKWVCFMNVLITEIMRASMGDVVMLESMYLNPDFIHDFSDVVTDMLIMHYEALFDLVGVPDGMFLYEDMGYTYGPIMSPELQREFIFPYHKRMFDFIHSYDIPVIMHSCGKIRPYLQSIFESGVDCLQVLEAKAGQHVAEFAKAVDNKMAFMGNLDIRAFESNDHDELEAEVIPKLDAVKENRIPFVFHSDHSIPKSVSLETYRYALELFEKHCRY